MTNAPPPPPPPPSVTFTAGHHVAKPTQGADERLVADLQQLVVGVEVEDALAEAEVGQEGEEDPLEALGDGTRVEDGDGENVDRQQRGDTWHDTQHSLTGTFYGLVFWQIRDN